MTVIARRVRSTPQRTAKDTWQWIVDLLAPDESGARDELLRISGLGSAAISSDCVSDAPIVVAGSGPLVRVYSVHGDSAVTGEGSNEKPLPFVATRDGWEMSLPCEDDDYEWFSKELKNVSTHVTARKASERMPDFGSSNSEAQSLTLDPERFLKP